MTLTLRPSHSQELLSLLRADTNLNISKLYYAERGNGETEDSHFPAFSTFQGWNASGRKFCRLSAGGTLYFLAIIVGVGRVWEASRLIEKEVTCISNLLRHPPGRDFPYIPFSF